MDVKVVNGMNDDGADPPFAPPSLTLCTPCITIGCIHSKSLNNPGPEEDS